MWFASIWIFTLRLPWQLGADFTYRQFLDGDPASNTLSWRWVAGLHTRGKYYLARATNITEFTGGRFAPEGLATRATPIEERVAHVPGAPPAVPTRLPAERCVLLLTEEDLHPESLGFAPGQVSGAAAAMAVDDRSPWPVSALVQQFTEGAVNDALARAQAQDSLPL